MSKGGNMSFGDWLVVILMVEFFAIALVYAVHREWPKAIYFSGAGIINIGVLLMK